MTADTLASQTPSTQSPTTPTPATDSTGATEVPGTTAAPGASGTVGTTAEAPRAEPLHRRVSPAGHLAAAFAAAAVTDAESDGRGIAFREIPFLTMVGLRAVPGSATRARLESLLGACLPQRVGTTSRLTVPSGELTALWLSPDEFLLVGDEAATDAAAAAAEAEAEDEAAAASAAPTGAEVEAFLARTVEGTPAAVLDLSANRTTLEISGSSARRVLEKGCPLDLHPTVFTIGTAVNTTLGKVSVILHRTAEDTYRVYPRSSFADHTGRWLIDAAVEFRVPEPPR